MATTTTNFGWDIPQSTDLVKDGATAIAALGQDIDTAMVDLKGGTTGQVLAKASGTDLDFSWVAQDDSNAIQNAIVDAKGDLIGATAADTPARLAVGTNGQVLTADSTASTGLAWTTVSSTPSFVGCSLYKNATQSVSNATVTQVTWPVENFDTDAFHDTGSNTDRVTIPSGKGGKYLITASFQFVNNTTGKRQILIYKNGVLTKYATCIATTGVDPATLPITLILDLAVADYISIAAFQTSGGSLNIDSDPTQSWLDVQYLGA
jgi:hypothetical protein